MKQKEGKEVVEVSVTTLRKMCTTTRALKRFDDAHQRSIEPRQDVRSDAADPVLIQSSRSEPATALNLPLMILLPA